MKSPPATYWVFSSLRPCMQISSKKERVEISSTSPTSPTSARSAINNNLVNVMTEPTPTPTAHPHLALTALRTDVQRLTPAAASMAIPYLTSLTLPDVWTSTLLRDLDARAGTTPRLDLAALVAEIGWPGPLGARCICRRGIGRALLARCRAGACRRTCTPAPTGTVIVAPAACRTSPRSRWTHPTPWSAGAPGTL
jgi:hypothetical protein